MEDVVQESLTNAWTALKGSDREIALKPWLYTIVRNRALNARRDMRYHSELDETADGVPRPDEIVLERDELSRAVAAIALLPDAQRKALVDSAIEGRTHDQIAAELGTSAGSVRGLIHRGRVAVRGAVGAVGPVPGGRMGGRIRRRCCGQAWPRARSRAARWPARGPLWRRSRCSQPDRAWSSSAR